MRGQGGDPQGKLEAVARAWASGRSKRTETDEFDDECAKFGIDPRALDYKEKPKGEAIIWPCMDASVSLFFSLTTQWRWCGAGLAGAFRTGLDYGVVRDTGRNLGVKVTPRVFEDIRVMEREALAVWSRK